MQHNIWTKLKYKNYRTALLGLFLLVGSSVAFSAQVPQGTKLADKQEISIQITAEVATLDPQKIEGSGKV